MATTALFVRTGGVWIFYGMAHDLEEVGEFIQKAETSIKYSKNMPIHLRTDNLRTIELPDMSLDKELER